MPIPVRDWVPPKAASPTAWENGPSPAKDTTTVVPNPLVDTTSTEQKQQEPVLLKAQKLSTEDPEEDKPSFLVRCLALPPWYALAISRPPTPPDVPESLFFLNWLFAFAMLVYAFGVSATNFFGIRQVRVIPYCSYSTNISVTELVPNNIFNLVLEGRLSDCAFCSRNATLGCVRTAAVNILTGVQVESGFNANNNPFSCGRGPSPDGPGCDIHPIISGAQRQYGPCMQTYAFNLQGVYLWMAVSALGCFLVALWLWYSESFRDIFESQFSVSPPVQTSSSSSYSFVASGGEEGGGKGGGGLKPSPSDPTLQQPLYPGKQGTCCWLPPRSGVWRWLCCWPTPRRLGPPHCCALPLSKRLPSVCLVAVCLGVVSYLQVSLTTQSGVQWLTGDCPDLQTVYLQNFDNIRATISMLQSALIAVATERFFSLAEGKTGFKSLVMTASAVIFNVILCKRNQAGLVL